MGGRSAKQKSKTKRKPDKRARARTVAPEQLWVWLGRGWVILALNAGPAIAQDLAPAYEPTRDHSSAGDPQGYSRRERVPVVFAGQMLGHIEADFLSNGAVSLDAAELYRLADPVLDPRDRDLLRALSENGRLTPFQMQLSNFSLEFEDNSNTLVLSAPAAAPIAAQQRAAPVTPADISETSTPLIWNGIHLGFVDVRIDGGRVSFPADRFTEVAGEALTPRARELLPVLEVGGRLAPFELSSVGVHVRYEDGPGILVLETPASVLSSITAPPIPPASAPATGQAQPQAASTSPTMTSPAPLVRARAEPAAVYWRDRYLGDTSVSFAPDGGLSFDSATFLAMANDILTAEEAAALRRARPGDRLGPISLETAGVSIAYDQARRALVLTTSSVAPSHSPPEFIPASTAVEAVDVAPLASLTPVAEPASPPPAASAVTPAPAPALAPTLAAAPAASQPLNTSSAPSASSQRQTTPPDEPRPLARPVRQMDFIYPLMLDGRYLGDIPLRFETDGSITFPTDRLWDLLTPLVDPPVLDELRARNTSARAQPFEDSESGIVVIFDDALQELQITIPGVSRRVQTIAVAGSGALAADETRFARPAPVAAYLNFDINQSYNHDLPTPREPLLGLLEGSVRLFGDSGFVVQGRATYREGAEDEIARDETRLIYDHVPSMISLTLGDLRLGTTSFQSAPSLGGISVERLFSLQPQRNFRPAGRRAISLDRRTTVLVIVNGVEMRRLDLLPGQYNIQDFPFAEGANDVRIVLEDEFGRREEINLSGYFDLELLAPGLSEFSYAIGVPASAGVNGITYNDDVQVYSMFHRIGVLSNLTVGVNAQGRDDAHLYGGEILWASPIGTIGLDIVHSDHPLVGEGDAALVRYEIESTRNEGLSWRFGLSSEWQSDLFSGINSTSPFGDYELQSDASLQLSHPSWGTMTFGYSYDQARPGVFDRSEGYIGYSRRLFRNLFGSVQVRHREEGDERETSGSLNLSWRLGPRDQLSFRHNSDVNTSELDWRRSGSYGVGGLSSSVRVGQRHDTGDTSAGGAISYYSNRFEATLNHDARTVGLDNDEVSQRTSLRVGGALAYAGERIAVGRPVRGAFAIVRGHESLERSPVILGGDIDRPRARSGLFGPALLSDLNTYSHEVVGVDVENLPPGYDLGSGQIDFRAYRGAGYDVVVGSAASVTVLATVLGPNGEPLSMIGGELRSLDDPEREAIQAFTNRTGRLAASGVTPGRYRLVLFAEPQLEAELSVAEGSVGLVQLGAIRVGEAQ